MFSSNGQNKKEVEKLRCPTDFFFFLLANCELVSDITTDAISSSAVLSVL